MERWRGRGRRRRRRAESTHAITAALLTTGGDNRDGQRRDERGRGGEREGGREDEREQDDKWGKTRAVMSDGTSLPRGTFALAGVCRWRFSTWIQASGSGWGAGAPSGCDSWLQELASPESGGGAPSGGDFSMGEEAERSTAHSDNPSAPQYFTPPEEALTSKRPRHNVGLGMNGISHQPISNGRFNQSHPW